MKDELPEALSFLLEEGSGCYPHVKARKPPMVRRKLVGVALSGMCLATILLGFSVWTRRWNPAGAWSAWARPSDSLDKAVTPAVAIAPTGHGPSGLSNRGNEAADSPPNDPREKAPPAVSDKPIPKNVPESEFAFGPSPNPDSDGGQPAPKQLSGRPTPPEHNADVRSSAEILKELDGVRTKTKSARSTSVSNDVSDATNRKCAELIGELYRTDPLHRRLPELLIERWLVLRADSAVEKEREEAAARTRGDAIGDSARYVEARLALEDPGQHSEAVREAIEKFASGSKGLSPRIPELLASLAERKGEEDGERIEIYRSIISKFPKSRFAQIAIRRLVELDENRFLSIIDPQEASTNPRIGKIFEFEFQDAVSGQIVSSRALHGRVIVVDFWATWCKPCVGSIPRMKQLYSKYAPEGVAFIGISLDYGPEKDGLRNLLSFVAENQVPWPQSYLGGKWDFPKSWGVEAIPTVFVVDQEGRIVTTKAGNLEQVLAKLNANPSTSPKGKTTPKRSLK